ncbi:MAG: NifU family protein [Bacteroidia bacterium]|nr:NifU family protein [Bacteroidia bacterium]
MIYTEMTPNPASLKFVLDRIILTGSGVEFIDVSTTESSPIANQLFSLPFVKSIFIGSHFVTITKQSDARWEEVIPAVRQEIQNYLDTGKAFVNRSGDQVLSEEDTNAVKRIRQLLDEHVRPAVAMDGGDIVFESFEDGIVKLRMYGSCSGCPSSTMTLKAGIQSLLTRFIPEVKEVISV